MIRYLVLCVLLLTAVPAYAESLRGMVKSVYDGDTVALVGRGIGRVKVRLYGIDAPETRKPERPGQPFGEQAKRVLMYKLLGREVTADVVEKDSYGRIVAVIRLAGKDVNAEMVAEGMAWAYRYHLVAPYASTYIRLEEQARLQRRGLWRDTSPQPPWEFRRDKHRRY